MVAEIGSPGNQEIYANSHDQAHSDEPAELSPAARFEYIYAQKTTLGLKEFTSWVYKLQANTGLDFKSIIGPRREAAMHYFQGRSDKIQEMYSRISTKVSLFLTEHAHTTSLMMVRNTEHHKSAIAVGLGIMVCELDTMYKQRIGAVDTVQVGERREGFIYNAFDLKRFPDLLPEDDPRNVSDLMQHFLRSLLEQIHPDKQEMALALANVLSERPMLDAPLNWAMQRALRTLQSNPSALFQDTSGYTQLSNAIIRRTTSLQETSIQSLRVLEDALRPALTHGALSQDVDSGWNNISAQASQALIDAAITYLTYILDTRDTEGFAQSIGPEARAELSRAVSAIQALGLDPQVEAAAIKKTYMTQLFLRGVCSDAIAQVTARFGSGHERNVHVQAIQLAQSFFAQDTLNSRFNPGTTAQIRDMHAAMMPMLRDFLEFAGMPASEVSK